MMSSTQLQNASLSLRAIDALRILTFRLRRWSIGILAGPSPFMLSPPADVVNPVISRASVTDVTAEFVADPFMIQSDGEWHMFFEVLAVRGRTKRGEVGYAASSDGLRWEYRGIVLRENCHLSYPYVFERDGEHYLIPETRELDEVRLYKGDPFPYRWTHVATLLRGRQYADSSVFEWDGRWWMLTQSASMPRHETLRLFCAPDVRGPWHEHPRSPVVNGNARIARPAGRVVPVGDRILRFAQDCHDGYGMRVHAFEIQRLTAGEYLEQECPGNPFLDSSGHGWNGSGMHHIDATQLADGSWIACVDGWTNRPWHR